MMYCLMDLLLRNCGVIQKKERNGRYSRSDMVRWLPVTLVLQHIPHSAVHFCGIHFTPGRKDLPGLLRKDSGNSENDGCRSLIFLIPVVWMYVMRSIPAK